MEEKTEKVAGNARNQFITALIATVPTFTYGIQIGWLSPMGPILKSSESPAAVPLNDSDITYMAATLPLAAICGIPFFSYASDKFGRKPSIIAVSLLSCICWIIKLTGTNPAAFIAARAIAGVAASGCFIVVPVYIKEIAEDKWRGTLCSLVMTVCKFGVIFVYALGMSLSYVTNQSVYLGICIVHIVLFLFMPSSPNFLLKKGDFLLEKKAIETIAWLRGLRKHDDIVIEEIAKLKEDRRITESKPKIKLWNIVRDRPSFSALRLTLTLMAMQTLSGSFALMNYASDVFRRAGTDWSGDVLALFMGSLQLAGSFFTTMSIDRFGRKIPLAASSFVMGVCMTALATSFLLSSNYGTAIPQWLPGLAICLSLFAYGFGLAPVPWVVLAEVFNFELRARMSGVSIALSFFCSSMTVLFYTPAANLFGTYVVFYAFGTVCLLGVVYTIFCVPETKGKTLEEIQEYWRDKKPAPVFV